MTTHLVGIFHYHKNAIPTVIYLSQESKFEECCESLPTDWAHLINVHSGKIIKSWK